MQMTEQSKPWYQHPLVWMVIAIPLSAVFMGVVMIWLAVDTDDGLVADDYYKQGLEINSDLSRDTRAAELGLQATIEFDSSADVMVVRFEKGQLSSYPDSLQLNLQHATRANSDIAVNLVHGMSDQYIGHLPQQVSEGVWYFEIADADWRLVARSWVKQVTVVKLQSEL